MVTLTVKRGVRALALALSLPALSILAPAFPASAETGWREVEPERLLVVDTGKGRILVEMNPDIAPLHVERIRRLAGEGFYDGAKWHRVIDGFMAQTGDPTGTGEGASAYENLPGELTFRRGPDSSFVPVARPAGAQSGFMDTVPVITQPDAYLARSHDGRVHGWATYCQGVAGMARGDAEDSANSQFFLMRAPYPSLDKRYSVWGRVLDGQSVVDALEAGTLPSGTVAQPDVMLRVRTADQMTAAERPQISVRDTRSAVFQQEAERVRQARGADFSVCDVTIAVRITQP